MAERAQVQTWMSPDAAERWQRMRASRAESMAAATTLMLDLAGIEPGHRVLDVAAGTGDQSIEAALRVGPLGYVLATDLSASMLQAAADAAREAGLTTIETRVADCQELDVEPDSFDAAICRNGLMFVPDRQKGLGAILRALKPGGRFAAVVWAAPEKNPWQTIPRQAAARHGIGDSMASLSMGGTGVLEQTLRSAGFRGVTVTPAPVNRHFASRDALISALKVSPSREAIGRLPEQVQTAVWAEVIEALKRFEGPNGYEIPGEALVGAGTK